MYRPAIFTIFTVKLLILLPHLRVLRARTSQQQGYAHLKPRSYLGRFHLLRHWHFFRTLQLYPALRENVCTSIRGGKGPTSRYAMFTLYLGSYRIVRSTVSIVPYMQDNLIF